MFKLSLKNDFTVGQTEISDISYYDPNAPCPNKLVGIETDLISTGQYFTQTIQPFFKLNNAPFLFYGKVDGKYSIEYFDHDSLSEFKPWIFYEIICAYFYQLCEK